MLCPPDGVVVDAWRLAGYFLRLGALGFGGPIALAGAMQRTLVDERRWFTREEFVEGLALAQLAPGPLAAQLAMYLGYLRGGAAGASLVAVAFILPSFLIVAVISIAYVRYGGLAWMQGVFYGVGAAVIGVIVRSAYRLARLSLGRDPMLWAIFLALAGSTAWTGQEIVWLFLAAGVLPLARRASGHAAAAALVWLPGVAPTATAAAPASLFWFFAQAGAFVFGSGLAIVPFLYGGVVVERGWLTDRQFLDAVAVAMITPGPVVITVAFIGYLVAGVSGMAAATIGVFLPVYLFVVIPAPYYRRFAGNERLRAFVEGVTAAATGAIAGAAIVLAGRAIVDLSTLAIALATLGVLARWRVSELWPIGVAAAAGVYLK
jgi:chromate transporter